MSILKNEGCKPNKISKPRICVLMNLRDLPSFVMNWLWLGNAASSRVTTGDYPAID